MIQIHITSNHDITKNGIIINPISCEINPILNGENELVMEFAIDDEGLYKYIQNNNFISVPTPDFSEDQLYRIYDTKKSMSGNKITAYARHIEFDLAKKVIFNKSLSNATGQQALDIILAGTNFTGHSNITIQNTIQYKLRNAMNVINGTEVDSFTSCYGGEISCNNHDLTINEKRISAKDIRVTFGYNLEDVEEDLNFDDVITRLYPYSGDLVLSGVAPYVDSPLISSIGVLEDPIEFSDIKVKESADDTEGFNTRAEAEAEMIRRCNKLFEKGLDKITANYLVKMQDLSKTTEYKRFGYDVLEKICLGDTVHCYNKNIDIEVVVRCISYKWDCINQEYIEIELGQFISSYVDMQNQIISDTNKKIDDTKNELKEETSNLKVVMEKKDSEIELSVTNEAEARTTAVNLLDGKIALRVTTEAFNSEIDIIEGEIESKVEKDSFGSYIIQHYDSIVQAIKDATGSHEFILDGTGATVKNGGFKIQDSSGKTVFYIESDGTVHIDAMGVDNLNIYDTSTSGMFYNALSNMTKVSLREVCPNRLTLNQDDFYIGDGFTLQEAIQRVIDGQDI